MNVPASVEHVSFTAATRNMENHLRLNVPKLMAMSRGYFTKLLKICIVMGAEIDRYIYIFYREILLKRELPPESIITLNLINLYVTL